MINVRADKVWNELGFTGNGVRIALVDDGIEYTHPDLNANYDPAGSYDFNYDDPDPFPDNATDDHGTSAAGVAGARNNSVCGVGIAYRATLTGIRLISTWATVAQEAQALIFEYNFNDIYSNSWGPPDSGQEKFAIPELTLLAIEQAIQYGRQGKGSIYIWAAGNGKNNGDNCNYDGYANSRYTIAIGAVDFNGIASWYSEKCAMLVGVAPSSGSSKSITTTDLMGERGKSPTDCTNKFGGTSSAAPLVSGITSLMLEANPLLSWRDVQGVLIASTIKNHDWDSDWTTNGVGLWVNHKYGFGLIDAYNSVKNAQNWTNLPEQLKHFVFFNTTKIITETHPLDIEIPINVSMTIEHVEIYVNATHQRGGDLFIELISPMGTHSILAEPHQDNFPNFDWKLGTIRNWGENSVGIWILRIHDRVKGYHGYTIAVGLNLYGH